MAQDKNSSKLNELQEVLLNDKDFLRRAVESFCQKFKDVEITQFLQADKYQRTEKRCGYRNGYKPRKLKTRVGTLELLVPQDREGRFQTQLFARYQRSEKALVSKVFRSLKRRGLREVRLVVSFDHEGLRKDVEVSSTFSRVS